MPTLKIVAACEKVIYDQDGPTSLISLFQTMKFQLQEAPLPERAIAPNQWFVFTVWESDPKEVGLEFTQVVKVYAPDGSLFCENDLALTPTSADDMQIRARLLLKALPVWQEGRVQIQVFIKGSESQQGSTSFRIMYLPKDDQAKSAVPPEIPAPSVSEVPTE